MNFKLQRAAIFSNWKAFVNGKEVETGAPRFSVNTPTGYARGLTDAGMLGDKTFYLSTGGWKYDTPLFLECSKKGSFFQRNKIPKFFPSNLREKST